MDTLLRYIITIKLLLGGVIDKVIARAMQYSSFVVRDCKGMKMLKQMRIKKSYLGDFNQPMGCYYGDSTWSSPTAISTK
jgi:hypothetical protein